MLFVEQAAHERTVLCLRHHGDISESTDLMIDLTNVMSIGAQDLHPTRHLITKGHLLVL